MATNDFLPFAGGVGANVVTQSAYAALTTLLANGFTTGIADPTQLNKVWRQGSIMSSALGALISGISGNNVVDDGTTSTILQNLQTALMNAGYSDDTSVVANTYTIALPFTPVAYKDGMRVSFSTLNANTGAATLNVNGLGAVAITRPGGAPLTTGQLPANTVIELAYNSTGPRFEMQTDSYVARTYSTTDWVALPGGLILNWITGSVDPTGSSEPAQTLTYARAFTTAVLWAGISGDLSNAATNADWWYQTAPAANPLTQIVSQRQQAGTGGWVGATTTPKIIAIGY